MRTLVAALGLILGVAGTATAHHSFAVHYDTEKYIEISGTVTDFRFANPHGIVTLTVTGENGEKTEWRAETNSPNLLKRRGWTEESIEAGQEVTVEGWPARDGAPLIRVGKVILSDGTELLGQGGRPEE